MDSIHGRTGCGGKRSATWTTRCWAKRGAARVYAPQKGATPEQVRALEAGLAHLAAVIERDLGLDVRELPGAGAAGGLGAGLKRFSLSAELRRGVDLRRSDWPGRTTVARIWC
ncbi:MAG: glycerate kinase [Candidatus Competibacteraceae bacterium]